MDPVGKTITIEGERDYFVIIERRKVKTKWMVKVELILVVLVSSVA